MSKFANGFYTVLNPGKYFGARTPQYRSSWEHAVFRMLDNNPGVVKWASESVHIPYINPFTQRQTIYVPDILVIFQDNANKQHSEMWEIKPMRETTVEAAGKSQKAQAAAVLNQYKWQAAKHYCASKGIFFRVLTEADIFGKTVGAAR